MENKTTLEHVDIKERKTSSFNSAHFFINALESVFPDSNLINSSTWVFRASVLFRA